MKLFNIFFYKYTESLDNYCVISLVFLIYHTSMPRLPKQSKIIGQFYKSNPRENKYYRELSREEEEALIAVLKNN